MEQAGKLKVGTSGTFAEDTALHACFLGLTPEVGSFHPTETMRQDNFSDVLKVIEEEAANLAVVNIPTVKGIPDPVAIINLYAAAMVIEGNIGIFPPRAQVDLKGWLTENTDEWFPVTVGEDNHYKFDLDDPEKDILHVRMGLLSGFPLDATQKYPEFMRARNKLYASISKDKAELVESYLDDGFPEIGGLISEYGGKLKLTQAELILSARRIKRANGSITFMGFTNEDLEHADRIERILEVIRVGQKARDLLEMFRPMLAGLPQWVLDDFETAHVQQAAYEAEQQGN